MTHDRGWFVRRNSTGEVVAVPVKVIGTSPAGRVVYWQSCGKTRKKFSRSATDPFASTVEEAVREYRHSCLSRAILNFREDVYDKIIEDLLASQSVTVRADETAVQSEQPA